MSYRGSTGQQSISFGRSRQLIIRQFPAVQPRDWLQKTTYVTKVSGQQKGIDSAAEQNAGKQKLEAHPEAVTTDSSVRKLIEPGGTRAQKPVFEGVKEELNTVKETFALNTVPRSSYYLGFAGTLPYLATSMGTLYLSWDLNTAWPTSSSFLNSIMIDHEAAQQWVTFLEPVQLGYGAVIISFLGAIHWGLEYAEKVPDPVRSRFRFGLGVMASVVAWPTMFMPVYYALTTQWAAFVALYFADAQATKRGWAPTWYGTYRFVLTAVVGAALVLSLIGRAKIGDERPRLSGLSEQLHQRPREQDYNAEWARKEQADKEKAQKEKEEAEKQKKREERKKIQDEKKKLQEEMKADGKETKNEKVDEADGNDGKADEKAD